MDDQDLLGIRSTIEKMLGRNLSPDAASQLSPAQASQQTDASGVPFYLSKERSPSEQQEVTPEAPETDEEDTETNPEEAAMRSPASSEQTPTSIEPQEAPEKNSLDFGQPGTQHTLDQALAGQKSALKDAQFQRGIEQLSGGIARLPVNNSQSDMMQKTASSPIQEYLLRNQEAANDPNSGLSKGLRAYMSKLGMDVSDGATANQLKQVMPFIFKDVEAKQAQKSKSEDLAERLSERKEEAAYRNQALKLQKDAQADTREQLRQDKLMKADTDRLDKASKLVTAEVASGRSAFGQSARNYQSIQNAQAMLDGSVDPNQLDNRQVYEMTRVLDRVLSQSGGTMGGAEHLTPDTARGRLSKLMEFVTNKRQGAQAGDFMKTFSDTLSREGNMAQKQMSSAQKSLLAPYKDLYQRHPEQWTDMLAQKGIPADVFENKHEESHVPHQPTVSVDDPKDQAAVQRIMQNNPGISLEDATKALHNYKAKKSGQ